MRTRELVAVIALAAFITACVIPHLYHVVSGAVMAKDVKSGDIKSLEGTMLHAKVTGHDVTINDAKVVKADIVTTNGVIHVIDTVVLPK